MRQLRAFRRDERGVSAVEFALIAPVFILIIVGIAQMGHLFYAHAGLRNAVSEGARFATIHPRPTNDQIVARINAHRATLNTGRFTTPRISYRQDSATSEWYAEISMSYSAPLNFLFFETPPVTLNYTRRTWVQAPQS